MHNSACRLEAMFSRALQYGHTRKARLGAMRTTSLQIAHKCDMALSPNLRKRACTVLRNGAPGGLDARPAVMDSGLTASAVPRNGEARTWNTREMAPTATDATRPVRSHAAAARRFHAHPYSGGTEGEYQPFMPLPLGKPCLPRG